MQREAKLPLVPSVAVSLVSSNNLLRSVLIILKSALGLRFDFALCLSVTSARSPIDPGFGSPVLGPPMASSYVAAPSLWLIFHIFFRFCH